MADANISRAIDPEAAIARWHLTLAMLAGNDNAPRGLSAGAMATVLGLLIASTAAIAAGLRFLL